MVTAAYADGEGLPLLVRYDQRIKQEGKSMVEGIFEKVATHEGGVLEGGVPSSKSMHYDSIGCAPPAPSPLSAPASLLSLLSLPARVCITIPSGARRQLPLLSLLPPLSLCSLFQQEYALRFHRVRAASSLSSLCSRRGCCGQPHTALHPRVACRQSKRGVSVRVDAY